MKKIMEITNVYWFLTEISMTSRSKHVQRWHFPIHEGCFPKSARRIPTSRLPPLRQIARIRLRRLLFPKQIVADKAMADRPRSLRIPACRKTPPDYAILPTSWPLSKATSCHRRFLVLRRLSRRLLERTATSRVCRPKAIYKFWLRSSNSPGEKEFPPPTTTRKASLCQRWRFDPPLRAMGETDG